MSLHPYQQKIRDHIIENPRAGVFVDMGYGKTYATLDAISCLPQPVLIVAPLRVVQQVWQQEAKKWGFNYRFARMVGNVAARTKAFYADADIYMINVENLTWLRAKFSRHHTYKTIIFDESSLYKTPGSKRSRAALWMAKHADNVVLLTGTPSPNGLGDLYHQIKILDGGLRLGRSQQAFRQVWCYPENPYFEHSRWLVRPEREPLLRETISDICMSLDEADTLDLPGSITNDITVHMPVTNLRTYNQLKKDMYAVIQEEELEVLSAGALVGKLAQYASGAVYETDSKAYFIEHIAKLTALDDIIEEAERQPILIWYAFKHSAERIAMRYPGLNVGYADDIDAWNNGELDVLIMHPASGGHGLNLQDGGHIMVWFDMTWNLEHYQQACARLARQGQTKPVMIHRLLTADTIDVEIADALEGKADVQSILMKELSK